MPGLMMPGLMACLALLRRTILTTNGAGITITRWDRGQPTRLGWRRDSRSRCLDQGNYLSLCDVISCVSAVTIRLSTARAQPVADNVEVAHRREDGWTTGWIQQRLRPLRQAALLLSRTLTSGRESSLSRNQTTRTATLRTGRTNLPSRRTSPPI